MIDRQWLIDRGFTGFVTVAELRKQRLAQVATSPGVYAILWESETEPKFLASSVGGRFKGKDPSVPIQLLKASWVPESQVIYIGKAGSADSGPSIRRRLAQYLDFGDGKPVGHWGGRFVWQLADSAELIVAWRVTDGVEPRTLESELIAEFEAETGRLPFANLTR